MLLNLPVVRSPRTRILFVSSVLVTIACLMWLSQLAWAKNYHGLSPIFFTLLTEPDYTASMAALAILLIALFFRSGTWANAVLRTIGERPGIVAVGTFVVLSLGSLLVYRNHPLSMDEYASFLQSQAFAAGRLSGHFPPEYLDWLVPKGFQNLFLSVSPSTGNVMSGYWPSFALLLTPFTFLGIPWACNPVLSGLTIIAIHRLAIRLFDDVEAAGLAVLLTVASPVFFASGISYYSMTAHLLANAVFVLLLLEPTPRRLLLAGFVGSIALTLHNPVPHLLFALPWFAWLAMRPKPLRNLVQIGLGYLPLSLLLGLGWFWLLGDFMSAGTTAGGAAVPENAARLSAVLSEPSFNILFARMAGLVKLWLWAVPGLIVLACAGAWRWRADTRCRLLAASGVATLVGYVFVTADQGHGWGYRYFHSAWFVLPILASALWARRAPAAGQQAPSTDVHLTAFVVAAALLSLVIGVTHRGLQIRDFMSEHLAQLPRYGGTEPRVVIVDPSESFYGLDLVQNHALLDSDVITFVSHGADADAAVMKKFRPDFNLVYWDRHGEVWSAGPPVVRARAFSHRATLTVQ